MLVMQEISPEMRSFLGELRKSINIGMVGGSDLSKQIEQLGSNCKYILFIFFSFSTIEQDF